jgi:hypothetical protein
MRWLDRSDDSPHSHFSTLCATLLKFRSRLSRNGCNEEVFFHQDDKSWSLPFSANIIQKVAPFMVRAEYEMRDGWLKSRPTNFTRRKSAWLPKWAVFPRLISRSSAQKRRELVWCWRGAEFLADVKSPNFFHLCRWSERGNYNSAIVSFASSLEKFLFAAVWQTGIIIMSRRGYDKSFHTDAESEIGISE